MPRMHATLAMESPSVRGGEADANARHTTTGRDRSVILLTVPSSR